MGRNERERLTGNCRDSGVGGVGRVVIVDARDVAKVGTVK